MMNDNSNRAELKIQIDDEGAVDVYINGTTESLVYAICAAIRSIAYNLADNIDIEDFKSSIPKDEIDILGLNDITREELSQYFEPMILKEIIDNLDAVGNTKDELDNDVDDVDLSDDMSFTKLEFEVDKDFDAEKFKEILDECIADLVKDMGGNVRVDEIATNIGKDIENSSGGLNFDVFDRLNNENNNEDGEKDE